MAELEEKKKKRKKKRKKDKKKKFKPVKRSGEKPAPAKAEKSRATGKNKKWHDGLYVEIYRLALQGWGNTAICETLGVARNTFQEWRGKRPAIDEALQLARAGRTNKPKDEVTLEEYVVGRLPEDLKKLWKEINKIDKKNLGIEKLEEALKNRGKRVRQYLFLHALLSRRWNISEACRVVGIGRHQYEQWKKRDYGFSQLMQEMHQAVKDFYESALIERVYAGDTAAIVFANKTMNRDRGYNERLQVDVTTKEEHNINLRLEDLDLEPEVLRKILQAMERHQQKLEEVQEPRKIEAKTITNSK